MTCHRCRQHPAGTPGYYAHSAFCTQCQMDIFDWDCPPPRGSTRAKNDARLVSIWAELENALTPTSDAIPLAA